MQASVNSKQQQSLSGKVQDESLDQSNERLRDIYMNYKDLVHRCLIDIKQIEKGERRIFYFKPETFLLQDPEKQKAYREKLIKKISAVPNPDPIVFMGDELHKQMLETIQDESMPSITRKNLALFFKRRHYTLQHKKYKILIRWAHNALTTEYMERVGHEATFKYGKIEYEMENAINRCDRLEGDDDFENAKSFPRPNTKAKEGGSLYVENTDLEPVSTIRMDDIEVYMRNVTYDQKVNKLINKYLARLKWLPLYKRFEIWSEAVEGYNKLKESNLKRQEDFVKRILQRGEQTIPKNNSDLSEELEMIIENYNVSKVRAKILSKADQIIYSQRSDHELAPHMIDNSIELKIHILDKSLEYGIYGDIELDQGYSFAYQITIFFPTYFQRQIIKSQFSLYDAFAGEERDQNSIQKRNLQNMMKIDTNIFKDISTTKNNIPSQESLNIDEGFRSIKVIRLKTCAYWIDYCGVMQPKISTDIQKQAAFLTYNNPIDSLLRSALNFLDVNDLATVNRILEETARLHQAQQKDKFANTQKNKKKKSQQLQNFKKDQSDENQKGSMHDETQNLKNHFFNALKGDISQEQKDPLKDMPNISQNSLRYLPQHMIHAYYILRHMKSRDYKTKILYTLNYFRAIQKRMMLDLREFATRERILGDLIQPIIPSTEADKASQQNANSSYFKNIQQDINSQLPSKAVTTISDKVSIEKSATILRNVENDIQQEKNFSLFEDGYIKTENSILDMKKFKFKGKFNNRVFSTCPSIPRFHATFGEPIDFQPLNVEMERVGNIKHATDEGVKLMGRVDHIDIDSQSREVYVKDDFGIYILYDCTFQDMKDLEEEILKVGSYYIGKHEILVNTENEKPYPVIDRLSLMEDLLDMEQLYQFRKVELIQCYMETYEHISDPLEQQRLMQIVIDIMALRPRLNLNATYFRDSYLAEIQCLEKHIELLRMIIVNQMKIEQEENRRTQAYLDMTFKIANEQVKGKWTYADAEEFFSELKKRKATITMMNGGQGGTPENVLDPDQDHLKRDLEKAKQSQKNISQKQNDTADGKQSQDFYKLQDDSPTSKFLRKITEKQYGSRFQTQADDMNDDGPNAKNAQRELNGLEATIQGGFAAVLGLPPITVESLYLQYKEKDEAILDIMNENANFIRVYEGYPDFHLQLTGLKTKKLSQYRFNEWGVPINVLDFFDSLSFITKFYSTIQSTLTELQDVLKPHDSTLLTLIETKILERAFVEYQKTRAFLVDDLREYRGAEYLEDESIAGNADKLMFYSKDLVSHLTKTLKHNVNPFLLAKLDIETINFFDFVTIPKDQNPYSRVPLDQLREDMDASLKVAENVTRPTAGNYQRFFPQLKELMRKISIPSMLQIQCNAVEMLRLRQELLFAMSESVLLQEVYDGQCKLVNRQNYKVLYSDQINFENYLIDQSKVNYVDDGPAKWIDFDLAISEFDNMLKSNLNFRNPDAIKMMMCTSGLEELRAILHYQLMQKQLLIIGVRMNQLLLDTHMRALNELELVKKGYSIPNMVIKLPVLLQKTGDGFSLESYQREKQRISSNLVNEAAPVFYNVCLRKAKLRNTVSKKFSVFLTSVASTFSKVECSLRVLRNYKIKLLHSYAKEVMKEAYHDAIKIQIVNSCQKLRQKSNIFNIDEAILSLAHGTNVVEKPQVFKYEQTEFIENFFSHYNPFSQEFNSQFNQKDQVHGNQAFSSEKCEIINYFMIPSTISLFKQESINYEELSKLNQDHPSFDFTAVPDENNVEASLKQMLPRFIYINPEYPKDDYEKDRVNVSLVDFEGSYNYSTTCFGQLFNHYALLEKIFRLEYFISKITQNMIDTLNMEQAISNGVPFWSVDSETEQTIRQLRKTFDAEKLSEKILNRIITEKRAKVNLADDIINLSSVFGLFINKLQVASQNRSIEKQQANPNLLPRTRILEYLISYHEYRYQMLIHTFDKVLESYYQKGSTKEVKILSEFYQQYVKKDHVKISYRFNGFHSNSSLTRPEQVSLETSNLFPQYSNHEEKRDFMNSIQPIVNEHAMNPPQITLYEGIYCNQKLKNTQFVGQIPSSPAPYPCLETGLINLSESERSYINSTIHSVKSFMKDYLEQIHHESQDQDEYPSLPQLKKIKKFIAELIQAKQLKNALICWLSNSTLPLDPKTYQQYLQQYKNDIFWKIMNQKDQLPSIYTQESNSKTVLQQQATSKSGDSRGKEKNSKAEQSMILSQQLLNMQIQVLVDQVQTCKAETIVLSNEIERLIVKAAIQAVDSETAALANCFTINTRSIDMHIHPFQQFASTCYPQVDPNSHLDMVTKVAEVQKFVTKLRNRGTEVETLTSGPGMVFTIKDFNECLQILCRGLIKYAEREMRARSEDLSKKEQHYITLLYIKDRQIENLEERIGNTRENLDKLINSKMYEKGNQLIYELDLVNRQLRLFKDNLFAMERELRANIRAEFADTLRRNMRDLDTHINKFKDFKTDVTSKVKADLAQEQHKIEKVLKKKAEEFKNLSNKMENRESPLRNRVKFQTNELTDNSYGLSQHKDNLTLLEEINLLSEREARMELAQMWDKMRKLRIFWKTKEVLTIDKYEKEIFTLKKQQTSNACLWEQLAEAEKREKVLKQELVFTQQSLAASEKVIEKLKDDLRKSESDRIRLNQYKTNKSQRLEELEGKVRKFEVLENINLEKLIDTLGNKEKEIQKLKDIERNFNSRVGAIEKRKDNEIRDFRGQYQKELVLKRDVLERLEGLRMELRMLEKNEGSMAEVWKTKCKELVEICNNLKQENEMLRSRAISMTQYQIQQNSFNIDGNGGGGEYDNDVSKYNNSQMPMENSFQLPKLMPNGNMNKMLSNIQNSKYGSTQVSGTHTRHSSVAKQTDSQMQGPSLEKSMIGNSIGLYNDMTTVSKGVQGGMAGASMRSTNHKRGNSINDSQSQSRLTDLSQNKIAQNAQMNTSQQNKLNSQRFGVKGQQAHINQFKGYQSVRTSQVGGFKQNEDMAEVLKSQNLGLKAPSLFKQGGGLGMGSGNQGDFTNTTTSFNKQFMNASQKYGLAGVSGKVDGNNDQFSNNGADEEGNVDKAVGQSSDMSKGRFNQSADTNKTGGGINNMINRRDSQERYGTSGAGNQLGPLSSASTAQKRSNQNGDISGFIQSDVNSPL